MQNKNNPNFLVFLALEAAGIIPVIDNQNSFAPETNPTSVLAKLNLTGRRKPDTSEQDRIKAEQERIKAEQEKKEREEREEKIKALEVELKSKESQLKTKDNQLKTKEGELKVKKAELQIRLDAEEKKRKAIEEKKKEKEFKIAVEKMVDEKIKEEVAKRIETKVEKIVEDHNNLKYKSNILTQDRYLYPEAERNTFTLEKHRRFWEIEKRIQEHKEKYNHTFFDLTQTPTDTGSNKSYISALRGRLITMPTLASQLTRTDHSNSMIDYTEEKYQDTSNISVLGNRKGSEYLYDGYGGHKQEEEEGSIESVKPVLKGKPPQKKKETDLLIPKLQETAVGKNMLKNVAKTFEGSPYVEKLGSKKGSKMNRERVRTESSPESRAEEEVVRGSVEVKDSGRKNVVKEGRYKKEVEDVGEVTLVEGGAKKGMGVKVFDGSPKIVRRLEDLLELRCDYYANNRKKGKGEVKRSTSVIAEVSEGNLVAEEVTFRGVGKQEQGKKMETGKMNSESIVRQMYRIKPNTRKESSHEKYDRMNTTCEPVTSNKSYIEKLINERRKSGDFFNPVELKGWGFTSSKRTQVGNISESPGPKYDLSQYKGIMGYENKSVRANRYVDHKEMEYSPNFIYAKVLEKSQRPEVERYNMDKHTRGISFGTSKRGTSMPLSNRRGNASRSGNEQLPQLKSNQIDLFAREKQASGSPFVGMQTFNAEKLV